MDSLVRNAPTALTRRYFFHRCSSRADTCGPHVRHAPNPDLDPFFTRGCRVGLSAVLRSVATGGPGAPPPGRFYTIKLAGPFRYKSHRPPNDNQAELSWTSNPAWTSAERMAFRDRNPVAAAIRWPRARRTVSVLVQGAPNLSLTRCTVRSLARYCITSEGCEART